MLLARMYEVFPLRCPRCGEPMRLIAFVTDSGSITRILAYLGEPAEVPHIAAPARGPPWEADFDTREGDTSALSDLPEYEFDQRVNAKRRKARARDGPAGRAQDATTGCCRPIQGWMLHTGRRRSTPNPPASQGDLTGTGGLASRRPGARLCVTLTPRQPPTTRPGAAQTPLPAATRTTQSPTGPSDATVPVARPR
jgi:hypothetical protein